MIDIQFVRLDIVGHGGARRAIDFRPGLNVIVGPYGSGKTSLLELLKFALGGSSLLSEAVSDGVASVCLDVLLGGEVFTFERGIDSLLVDVKQHGELVRRLHTKSASSATHPLASRFILGELGIPDVRVRRSTRSSSPTTEPVSFWDIYRFIYVSQNDMGQSIAGHADSNTNRKRHRALELLLGLLDERLAELREQRQVIDDELAREAQRRSDVIRFIASTGAPTLDEIEVRRDAVHRRRQVAAGRLDELRDRGRASTQAAAHERDDAAKLVRDLARVDWALQTLSEEISQRRIVIERLRSELQSLARQRDGAELLGPLRFVQCPRCLQALDESRASAGHCGLCLQTTSSTEQTVDPAWYVAESARVETTIREAEDLQLADGHAVRHLERERSRLEQRLTLAEERIAALTDHFVTPLFEEIAAVSAQVEAVNAEQGLLDAYASQWSEVGALEAGLVELGSRRSVADEAVRDQQGCWIADGHTFPSSRTSSTKSFES